MWSNKGGGVGGGFILGWLLVKFLTDCLCKREEGWVFMI